MYTYVKYFLCFSLPLLFDRWTKYLIINNLLQDQSVTSWLNIYAAHNRGIAWGVGNQLDTSYLYILNGFIAVIILYFMWYMLQYKNNQIITSACLLILSGGISNFFDRIHYGAVIDFIHLHCHSWSFAIFNVADVSITLGAIFLCYSILFREHK